MSAVRFLVLACLVPILALPVRADEGELPRTVDDLIAALDRSHEPTAKLAAVLDTLDGRAALLDAAAEAKERRERALRVAARLHAIESTPGQWLRKQTAEWAADVALVEGVVDNLRRNLAGDDVLTSDMRAFLGREDAARALYRVLVRPRSRPFMLQAELGRCFASNDAGQLHVPSALAAHARDVLARDAVRIRAVERLASAGPALRRRLDVEAPAWSAVDLDTEAGRVALLYANGGWGNDPEGAAEELVRWGEEGETLPRSVFLRGARNLGAHQATARVARAYAARLADDPALDPWRALLRSPRALLLSPGGRLERKKAPDVLLNRTGFGRALVTSNVGTVRINPHARWDLDRILEELLEDTKEATGEGVADDLLDEIATWEAKGELVEALPAWIDETLEAGEAGLRVRDGVELEADPLDDAVPVGLDPDGLDYQVESLDLLRSSIFYNPRTGYGHHAYVTAFEDHHTARLFGTFGWNAKVSKDLEDFKRRIRARKRQLQLLAKTHDKLVIHMSGVPPWLSAWDGTGVFEGGGWEDKQAHPPKDVAVWKQMIRELALVFREVEGVERYYEFWNEPDLRYWQGSLDDFLALYEATVTTIREVDPDGRVGGCAVNQWDGRIHKKTGSDLLVHELIRFAAKKDLPLDFVSWHHFGRPVTAIAEAKASYVAELSKNGFDPDEVEYLVTEWSAGGRGTPYGGPAFADAMLGFFHTQIDAQSAACWEEFHAKPNPKGFPPWGLMTQQGDRHATWYVHRFFDRLARGSRGVAVVRGEDRPVVVVSQKDDGVYDLLVWRTGMAPALRAALESLKDAGLEQRQLRVFGTTDRFERAMRERRGMPAGWKEDVFLAACDAYAGAGIAPDRLVLTIEGGERVEVLFAESVRTKHRLKDVAVQGNVLTCPLERYEVLRLEIRVR